MIRRTFPGLILAFASLAGCGSFQLDTRQAGSDSGWLEITLVRPERPDPYAEPPMEMNVGGLLGLPAVPTGAKPDTGDELLLAKRRTSTR